MDLAQTFGGWKLTAESQRRREDGRSRSDWFAFCQSAQSFFLTQHETMERTRG
jgi:hypothetical protein